MEQRIEYLLRQYETNNCSREELEELFSFINGLRSADPALRKAIKHVYNDICKNHPSFTYVDENGNLVLTEPEEDPVNVPDKAMVTGRAKWKLLVVVIVSCVVGLYALVWIVKKNISVASYIQKPVADVSTKKYTSKSNHGHINLSDSTDVWLNTASTIEIPDKNSSNNYEVHLQGEAFFNTQSKANINFVIKTHDITISAFSRSFNVKAYPKDRHLIINSIDGKIRVSKGGELLGVLTGGQTLKINKEDGNITRKAISAENIAAWRQGNMVYEEEYLADIVADIERIYDVDIVLAGAGISDMRVSFSFEKSLGITQVLENLCSITNTELDGEDGKFIIL